MTATVVIPHCSYDTFDNTRRAVQMADPTLLTYESYDRHLEQATFTFREPMAIPDELEPFRIKLVVPKRPNFSKVTLPDVKHALEAKMEKVKKVEKD